MVSQGLKIKERSIKNIPNENLSITKDTLEKMWQNILNEFNLNTTTNNKQKKNVEEQIGSDIISNSQVKNNTKEEER